MMRPNSILSREDKRHVAVMARLIDLVYERWSDAILTLSIQAVAGGTDRGLGLTGGDIALGHGVGSVGELDSTCGQAASQQEFFHS